mmetsp:Transcript_27177/g.40358  ORF Transcript_27177/g.40358 Transcript_27177/m.40358 type:complete len:102 (+) Transcript_27177:211-516(+)
MTIPLFRPMFQTKMTPPLLLLQERMKTPLKKSIKIPPDFITPFMDIYFCFHFYNKTTIIVLFKRTIMPLSKSGLNVISYKNDDDLDLLCLFKREVCYFKPR